MNGAESVIATLSAGGVEVCFANPGTSELHLVAALDSGPPFRCVLGLFEGVVTGAADGYARMSEKPACTLLHLGPGIANGLANLHNAKRARVPVINLVGDHPKSHYQLNPPLAADVEATARPYCDWIRVSESVKRLGADTAAAIAAARSYPGQVATLIIPCDLAWGQGGTPGDISAATLPRPPDPQRIEEAAALLRRREPTAILLGPGSLHGAGLAAAGRLASASGATLLTPYPLKRLERGHARPKVHRIPYPREQATKLLARFKQLIVVGTALPVAYFAHPASSALLIPPGCEVYTAAETNDDNVGVLEALADSLSPQQITESNEKAYTQSDPEGAISLSGLAAAIAATLPEGAVVIDESMTSGRQIMAATQSCPPHDWIGNTGGSIGIALPLAIGAAIACPDRRVLCLSAEGSGMYTAQALWTMSREGLNVTILIFNNRRYGVLQSELVGMGLGELGPRGLSLLSLDRPPLDWTALARGMGVPSCRTDDLQGTTRALRLGLAAPGPSLIEVLV